MRWWKIEEQDCEESDFIPDAYDEAGVLSANMSCLLSMDALALPMMGTRKR